MRLTLFLCAVFTNPVAAQQIGTTDPAFVSVEPVQFCVDLQSVGQIDGDLADWTFPNGAPAMIPINGDLVPARAGQGFGFAMQATRPLTAVTVNVTHPPLADTGKTFHTWQIDFPSQTLNLSYYAFGRITEVTSGDWTFTYSHSGRVLYQHKLTLVGGDLPMCTDN